MHVIESIARSCGVKGLVDYGEARAPVLVVASGCGIMMATMDACDARWCVDVDTEPSARVVEFIATASRFVRVGVSGWFSHHSPDRLIAAVALCRGRVPTYGGGGVSLGGDECASLAEFAQRLGVERVQSEAPAVRHESAHGAHVDENPAPLILGRDEAAAALVVARDGSADVDELHHGDDASVVVGANIESDAHGVGRSTAPSTGADGDRPTVVGAP